MPHRAPSTAFKPGQSGNPKGRPKRDWTWAGELQKAAEEAINGVSIKEAMAKSMVKESLKGNVQAFNAIVNRMDGMPQQDITSAGEAIQGPTVFIPIEDEN